MQRPFAVRFYAYATAIVRSQHRTERVLRVHVRSDSVRPSIFGSDMIGNIVKHTSWEFRRTWGLKSVANEILHALKGGALVRTIRPGGW
jgi:hypothetical protein